MTAGPGIEEAAEILRDGFGVREMPLEILPRHGTSAAAFRIVLADRSLFLKCRAAEHALGGQARFEHGLLALLAAEGFPVAAPLPAPGGGTLVSFHDRLCELMPWVDGIRFRPGDADMIAETGAKLARLHRITARVQRGKDGQEREDDPERLLGELDLHLRGLDTGGAADLLGFIRDALRRLSRTLPETVYGRLPRAVIHGDFHPGNALYDPATSRLAGLFDFDWANRQERVRDVCDALLFFCSADPLPDAFDIRCLTRSVGLEPESCRILLASYEAAWPLTDAEREALPAVMEARWLQARIRGMRKVPPDARLPFLDRGNLVEGVRRIRAFTAGGTAPR